MGLSEIGPLDINDLEFEDWVRSFCQNGCRHYNGGQNTVTFFGAILYNE